MSILNTLLAGPSDTAVETKAAEPLIKARAESDRLVAKSEAEANKARACRENFSTLVDDFIKLYEVAGKQLNFSDLEDFLAGIELLAESQAKASKVITS